MAQTMTLQDEDSERVKRWQRLWLWLLSPLAVVLPSLMFLRDLAGMVAVRALVVPALLLPGVGLAWALATYPLPRRALARLTVAATVATTWAGWAFWLVHLGAL